MRVQHVALLHRLVVAHVQPHEPETMIASAACSWTFAGPGPPVSITPKSPRVPMAAQVRAV
jgi:hypothetical protein